MGFYAPNGLTALCAIFDDDDDDDDDDGDDDDDDDDDDDLWGFLHAKPLSQDISYDLGGFPPTISHADRRNA